MENIQRALDDLLSGLDGAAGAEEDAAQPSGMVTDPRMIDLAGMDEDALNALRNRISRELERRAMEEAGVSLENGTVVVDQNGVRMTLYEDNRADRRRRPAHRRHRGKRQRPRPDAWRSCWPKSTA